MGGRHPGQQLELRLHRVRFFVFFYAALPASGTQPRMPSKYVLLWDSRPTATCARVCYLGLGPTQPCFEYQMLDVFAGGAQQLLGDRNVCWTLVVADRRSALCGPSCHRRTGLRVRVRGSVQCLSPGPHVYSRRCCAVWGGYVELWDRVCPMPSRHVGEHCRPDQRNLHRCVPCWVCVRRWDGQ
jgi:hypothetical protein